MTGGVENATSWDWRYLVVFEYSAYDKDYECEWLKIIKK